MGDETDAILIWWPSTGLPSPPFWPWAINRRQTFHFDYRRHLKMTNLPQCHDQNMANLWLCSRIIEQFFSLWNAWNCPFFPSKLNKSFGTHNFARVSWEIGDQHIFRFQCDRVTVSEQWVCHQLMVHFIRTFAAGSSRSNRQISPIYNQIGQMNR